MIKQVCGGWSGMTDADEEIQKICDEIKCEVEEQAKNKYKEFRAVKYKKQTVKGYKYLIKVHIGGENYIHLNVFDAVADQQGLQLRGVQVDKTEVEPL